MFNIFKKKKNPILCHNDYPIAGVSFSNDDGTSRQDIIKTLKDNDLLNIEVYKFNGEDAISVNTLDGKQIGNIKREHIPFVLDRIKTLEKCSIFDIHSFIGNDNKKIYVAKIIIYYWN